MQEVKYCTKCGKELPKDAVFCPNCGTNVQAGVAPPSETYWSSRQYRRVQRRQRRGDWWGAVTAFGFLIIIAATIVRFPDVFSRLINYLASFGVYGHPVLPSYSLGQVVVFFFFVAGIWGIVAAALRFVFTGSVSRASQDTVGGLFSLYISNVFAQFYAHAYGGWGLVVVLIIGLAVVIVANALIAFFIPSENVRHIST